MIDACASKKCLADTVPGYRLRSMFVRGTDPSASGHASTGSWATEGGPQALYFLLEEPLIVDRAFADELRHELQLGTQRNVRGGMTHGCSHTLGSSTVTSYCRTAALEFAEALHHVQGFGVHEAMDFGLVVETDRIDHESVAVPAANRGAHPRWIGIDCLRRPSSGTNRTAIGYS